MVYLNMSVFSLWW